MKTLQVISLPDRFRRETRGWSFTPFSENPFSAGQEVDWGSFHTVSLEPGTVRGNHVHTRVTEWLFFCGGPVLLVWQDEGSEEIRKRRLEDPSTYLVIPPGVRHAVQNLGPGIVYLIAFRSLVPPSPEPETLATPLI